jgi:hypothetical protein
VGEGENDNREEVEGERSALMLIKIVGLWETLLLSPTLREEHWEEERLKELPNENEGRDDSVGGTVG